MGSRRSGRRRQILKGKRAARDKAAGRFPISHGSGKRQRSSAMSIIGLNSRSGILTERHLSPSGHPISTSVSPGSFEGGSSFHTRQVESSTVLNLGWRSDHPPARPVFHRGRLRGPVS